MLRYAVLLLFHGALATATNLDYLDPTKLQTITSAQEQQKAASTIIQRYLDASVVVNSLLFKNNKDVFTLKTNAGQLHITASSGVAALWGFNYFLKKYCKSQIAWQVSRVSIPRFLPEVDETVVANDRFRYYQNVCTVSYSFVWWNTDQWKNHVEWMAMNGINMALAPVAQEAAWAKVYRHVGMTQEEIDRHFTGPAFLSWLRMGNFHGWGGPLPQSWHNQQRNIQDAIVDYMLKLGIVPVFPSFNGHVPKAFSRVFPNETFYEVENWMNFDRDYCCGLFIKPSNPLFKKIGKMFLKEITAGAVTGHIYTADSFNEIKVTSWSTQDIKDTGEAIFSVMHEEDEEAVWLLQNWFLVNARDDWPKERAQAFLTSVPEGRILVLDLQSELFPQFRNFDAYFGQPFLWCLLHNFGGTHGMYGSIPIVNEAVADARLEFSNAMIGIGLTPEGINQNYVVYDFMLEMAWRPGPVEDLDGWVADYAERRYGCNRTAEAWKLLLRSVYSYGTGELSRNFGHGVYVVSTEPSLSKRPWAWYRSRDLFNAIQKFVFITHTNCFDSPGFRHDLIDVIMQGLLYRSGQLYMELVQARRINSWVFKANVDRYLDIMGDMEVVLNGNTDFSIQSWINGAKALAGNGEEAYLYDLNARNQITLWGPNGEINDYAGKFWGELFTYYYIPRWRLFLSAAADALAKKEYFDEDFVKRIVKASVYKQFQKVKFFGGGGSYQEIVNIFKKWDYYPGLPDLPRYSAQNQDEHFVTKIP